jgi:hypothetical protein
MAPRAACRSGFHPLPLQTVREVLPHTAFRQPSPGRVRGVEGAYSRQIEVFHSALGEPVLELRHRETSSETVAGRLPISTAGTRHTDPAFATAAWSDRRQSNCATPVGPDTSWPPGIAAEVLATFLSDVVGLFGHAPSLTSSLSVVEAEALPSDRVVLSRPSTVL